MLEMMNRARLDGGETEKKRPRRRVYVQLKQLAHALSDRVHNIDAYSTGNPVEDFDGDVYLSFLVVDDWPVRQLE